MWAALTRQIHVLAPERLTQEAGATWKSAFQPAPEASGRVLGPRFCSGGTVTSPHTPPSVPHPAPGNSLGQAPASAQEACGAPSLEAIWKPFHYSFVEDKGKQG